MTPQRESHIRRHITSPISPQLIRRRGRDPGVVQRQHAHVPRSWSVHAGFTR